MARTYSMSFASQETAETLVAQVEANRLTGEETIAALAKFMRGEGRANIKAVRDTLYKNAKAVSDKTYGAVRKAFPSR